MVEGHSTFLVHFSMLKPFSHILNGFFANTVTNADKTIAPTKSGACGIGYKFLRIDHNARHSHKYSLFPLHLHTIGHHFHVHAHSPKGSSNWRVAMFLSMQWRVGKNKFSHGVGLYVKHIISEKSKQSMGHLDAVNKNVGFHTEKRV